MVLNKWSQSCGWQSNTVQYQDPQKSMHCKALNLCASFMDTLTLFLNPPLAAYEWFTWDAEYFPSKCYTFTSHYHVKLFSIKCKPWNWVCMSTARTAKHLAENPFHIRKGCYSLSVPWLCAQMPTPLAFLLSAKGNALLVCRCRAGQ